MNSKYSLLSILLILLIITGSVKLSYDKNAVIDRSLHNKIKDGYYIVINSNIKYPYLYFRDIDNKRYTYATYNWRFQYWVSTMKNFDPSLVDLTGYFINIGLTKSELNRSKPAGDVIFENSNNNAQNTENKDEKKNKNDNSLDYDPDAVPDFSLNNTIMGNYKLYFNDNPEYNYVLFFEKKTNKIHAVYNYRFQYWVRKDDIFDMKSIYLERLYKKINNKNFNLDRMSFNKKENNEQDVVNKDKKEDIKTEKDNFSNNKNNYNNNQLENNNDNLNQAVINFSMNNKILNGYKIVINKNSKIIYFYKPDYPYMPSALYNYENKYWITAHGDFYIEDVDFTKLFIKSANYNFNNWIPGYKHIRRLNRSIDYNYFKDKDFSDFISYANRSNVDQRQIDFYLKAADNPDVRQRMQYYFDMHKNKRGMSSYEMFIKNDPVVLTIIELMPLRKSKNNLNYTPAVQLKNQVKLYFENAFKKDFIVKTARTNMSYREFGTIPKGAHRRTYQNNYLKNNVDHAADDNSLIIYYFVDIDRAYEFSDIYIVNPMGRGSGMADFTYNAHLIIHELGHTLQMQHHFDLNRLTTDPQDLNNHTSSSCIMNYEFRSAEFCPLCLYALDVVLK